MSNIIEKLRKTIGGFEIFAKAAEFDPYGNEIVMSDKEDNSNKTTTIASASGASDEKYPSEKAVATALATKADTSAIPDVSGKAEKSEMSVEAVSGDATKKTVTLKSGLSVNVVTEHKTELPTAGKNAGKVLTIQADGSILIPAWKDIPTELPDTANNVDKVLTVADEEGTLIPKWLPIPTEIPASGTIGQVLKKTSDGVAWSNESTELPSGGSEGQVLKKTSSGTAWSNETQELPGTYANEGKFLSVINGYAEWADLPGETVPSFSSADKNKVLTVEEYSEGEGSSAETKYRLAWIAK